MKTNIEKIMELILKDADNKAQDAGFGGRMDDGGASKLRDQVKMYKAGMRGSIPVEWEKYAEQIEKVSDPEFSEYVRLKQKFE